VGSEGAAALSFFKRRNALAAGFGPDVAHTTDEYCNIKDVSDGARAFEDFIKAYLGTISRKNQ
jgi:acetylornithine deacetylase/succinyl-diaminopimelate desuccinylase-like protein